MTTPEQARNIAEQLASIWLDGAADALRDLANQIEALTKERDALKEDAERGRYMLDNGCWHRGDEQTHLAVLVPQGSDLSCYAMRVAAIDKAMGKPA